MAMVEKLTPQRRRQLTRDALIEAAAEVFAEQGFAGASLEEIAAAAGFTRGAIYSNFSGKEELLLAVLDRRVDEELAAYREAIGSRPEISAEARAAGAVDVWGEVETKRFMLLSLELNSQALRNPDVRRRVARFDRDQIEKACTFMEQELEEQGLQAGIPVRDVVIIGRAAEQGLALAAAIDREHADEYRSALARLFELLGTAMREAPAGD